MSTQAVAQLPKNNEVEFVPFGADEKIKLSVEIIRKYVAAPSKSGKLPDDRECIQFMMLCRSRKLNPFEGDAFLIGYDGQDGTKWTLITAHAAFLKRAESHPEYDGMESGVIVKDANDKIIDREGDFFFEDDKLLGAWAVVHFKQRKHAMKKRVKLSTFVKPFGVWKTDPAGMIVKCAEADALRSSFPSLLGGLYTREESPEVTISSPTQAKAPDFGPAEPRQLPQRMPEKPQDTGKGEKTQHTPEKPPQQPAASAEPAKSQTDKSDEDGDLGPRKTEPAKEAPKQDTTLPPDAVRIALEVVGFKKNEGETDDQTFIRFDALFASLMAASGVNEKQVIAFCKRMKVAKDNQNTLKELSAKKIVDLAKAWATVLPEIRKEA